MDMGFTSRKNAIFQASIKLAQPFPAPDQKTFPGRVRVESAQVGPTRKSHEKATKNAQTLFF